MGAGTPATPIPFGEWLPDQADLNNPGATVAKNVIPHAMGYAPLSSVEPYSEALTAYCRGAISTRDKDNNVYIYAGDETKLKVLNTMSWTDVTRSSGGDYATASGERWEFAQFGEKVIGTNFTDDPQVITMSGSNFAALGGSPPKARHIAVAGNFVILGNVNASGTNVPNRVHWSGIGDETTWAVSATTQADFTDLENGGWVQRIFGGEYAVVLQERSIRRMTYVGSPVIWQIDEVVPNDGLLAPGGAAQSNNKVFFLSNRGFYVLLNGSQVQPIGANKVDSFVINDIDTDNLDRVSCAVDEKLNQVYWAYPGSGNTGGRANKIVIYDYSLDRWSYSEQETQQLFVGSTTGYTLDGLDSITTDLDALTPSLDDTAWTGGRFQLAKFDSDNKMGFFSGTPMNATIETTEFQLSPNRNSMITSVRPLVDGGTTTIRIGTRKKQGDTEAFTMGYTVNTNGRANARKNARYHRVRASITGSWSVAQGVQPEFVATGWR